MDPAQLEPALLAEVSADGQLMGDLSALCDFGGRLAGTPGEQQALDWASRRLGSIRCGRVRSDAVRYAGWRSGSARLTVPATGATLACKALLGSQSTPAGGLEAEVVDLGRGTREDFDREGRALAGRIALVRHEYPFAIETIHRRFKVGWATEASAAGFIIANPDPGGTVCGSSGRGGGRGIPAVATDLEGARALPTGTRVRMVVEGTDVDDSTRTITCDFPGQAPEWIVLSAHVDGHDLAESALDNGSGVVTALAVARALSPHAGAARRGLRIAFFSAEEWALSGSRAWLAALPPAERTAMRMNVNLDTVAGDTRLTALTSGFIGLEAFVRDTAASIGIPVGIHRPLMQNSDHANFALAGIPAFRLVAGFDNRACDVRHILTPLDTRERVRRDDLVRAARVATALCWRAMNTDPAALAALA